MKNMKFKNRIFLSFCAVLVLAVFVPGFYVYKSLEREILRESRQEAINQVDFIHWMFERDAPFETGAELDAWCTTLGEKLGFRITIIKHGGTVIADSSIEQNEIRYMENHADREEIRSAESGGTSASIRYSSTVNRSLIYAAKKIQPAAKHQSPLYLRAAYPVSLAEKRLNSYANRFWVGIALILGLAFLLSIYLAGKLESPVHQTMNRLKEIAGGDFSHKYIMNAGREFYELSMTLNETADRIREQMEVISGQNQEMEAIIENMREGVMLIDRSGRIKALNRSMGNIAECQLSCIGKRPLEVFLNSEVQNACDKIQQGENEHNLTISSGHDTFYEVYAAKIPEGGALIVLYDVSEQKRLEKIRRDFVANVSHELKTPLTSIKGYVETLVSGGFSMDEQALSFLGIIQKNAARMTNIVDDLLQLTRLEEKPGELNLRPIDAAASFHTAWETCLLQAEEKNINLENLIPAPLPVIADDAALQRVFRNLLDNAVRFSPAGTAITAFAEARGSYVIFIIRDQGPGISEEHRERIFERFYRIDRERSRASGGTGLGLSICKHAVSAMQGCIWLQSPPGDAETGTEFFFTLPAAEDVREQGNKTGYE